MAHARMPRQHHQVWWDTTAWVSKPRHRSPPIRPGEDNPRSDHGFKILRPGKQVEGTSHQSARQKGRSRFEKQSATGGCHHPHPSPPSVPEANIPQGPEPARPNRNSRPGKALCAQIQPSEKIKKTPCFDLILLTLSNCPRRGHSLSDPVPPAGMPGFRRHPPPARCAQQSLRMWCYLPTPAG